MVWDIKGLVPLVDDPAAIIMQCLKVLISGSAKGYRPEQTYSYIPNSCAAITNIE